MENELPRVRQSSFGDEHANKAATGEDPECGAKNLAAFRFYTRRQITRVANGEPAP